MLVFNLISPLRDPATGVVSESTPLAILRAHAKPGANKALLFGAACDPALPLSAAGAPLVKAAVAALRERRPGEKGKEEGVATTRAISGWCRLPNLCRWLADTKAWELVDASLLAEVGHEISGDSDADVSAIAEAVEAVAMGKPRRVIVLLPSPQIDLN
jgi:hypothetical protein